MLMMPSTPSMRAANVSGNVRLKKPTPSDQVDSASAQSSMEPSCAPQTAAKR
jgi:hypothetical protein